VIQSQSAQGSGFSRKARDTGVELIGLSRNDRHGLFDVVIETHADSWTMFCSRTSGIAAKLSDWRLCAAVSRTGWQFNYNSGFVDQQGQIAAKYERRTCMQSAR